MRGSWLRMLVLGFVLGPAASSVDAGAAEPEPMANGLAIRGSGVYIWDEDERMARSWAAELGVDAAGPDALAMLRGVGALERTWLISSWATSPDEPTRRRLARALAEPIDVVGARWVLAHLESDPSPEVRRLARLAAASGTDRA